MPGQGYGFVPLPDTVARREREQARFDRHAPGCMGVVIDLEYVNLEAVHVGSGFWTLHANQAVRSIARSGEHPVLPGSSMKGVLRARYEAITRSCAGRRAPKGAMLGDRLPSRTFPGHRVEFSQAVKDHPVFTVCRPPQLCPACALFGQMSQRGRVAVHDFAAAASSVKRAELPKRFSPRPHHLGSFEPPGTTGRIVVHTLHGRKLHEGSAPRPEGRGEAAEVLAPGTRITGRVVCSNVTNAELGGLMSALGVSPQTELKVGSAKAHHYGRLALAGVSVDVVRRPRGFQEDGFFARIVEGFHTSEDYWAKGERALIRLFGSKAP